MIYKILVLFIVCLGIALQSSALLAEQYKQQTR